MCVGGAAATAGGGGGVVEGGAVAIHQSIPETISSGFIPATCLASLRFECPRVALTFAIDFFSM